MMFYSVPNRVWWSDLKLPSTPAFTGSTSAKKLFSLNLTCVSYLCSYIAPLPSTSIFALFLFLWLYMQHWSYMAVNICKFVCWEQVSEAQAWLRHEGSMLMNWIRALIKQVLGILITILSSIFRLPTQSNQLETTPTTHSPSFQTCSIK